MKQPAFHHPFNRHPLIDAVRCAVGTAATAALFSIAAFPLAEHARAQDGAPASRAAIEEVLVTARRREESAQAIPVAVSAFGAEKLQDFRIEKMEDLRSIAPSLSVSASSGRANSPVYSLRGVRPTEALYGQDPTVAVYFADVVLSPARGSNLGMYDLGSVQVLKGPQGTLFGRNTTGGAILLTPQRPGDEFSADVTLGFGNYDRNETQFGIDLPVSEAFKLRASGRTVDSDGFQTNVASNQLSGDKLGGRRDRSARITAVWNINDRIENDTILTWDEMYIDGRGHVLQAVNPNVFTGGNAVYLQPLLDTLTRANQRDVTKVETDLMPRSEVEVWGVFNTTTFDLADDMMLKSIFGYRDLDAFELIDLDASAIRVLTSDQTSTLKHASYELQLLGKALDDRLDWVAGAYYYYEDGTEDSPGFSRGFRALQTADMTNTSYSLFGQGTFHFSDQWSATAGLRWTYDDKEMTIANRLRILATNTLVCTLQNASGAPLPIGQCSVKLKENFDQPTGTVSVEYKPDDNMLFYVASRYGYRAGGFNARGNRVIEREPFDAETVLDLELGAKLDWFVGDWQMRSNIAVYQQWYDDIQRTVSILNPLGGVPGSTIQNAAKAEIFGIEIEQVIAPTENLNFTVSYVYTDPEYKSWRSPATGADLSSTPFQFTPEHAASLTAAYTWPLGDAGSLRFVASAFYQDDIWINSLHTIVEMQAVPQNLQYTLQQEAYWLYDASVSWNDVMGKALDVTAYVKNLTDEEYTLGGIQLYHSGGVGFNTKVFGDPRTYGLQFRFRF
jgi:iron complex outermembrane receptor protein